MSSAAPARKEGGRVRAQPRGELVDQHHVHALPLLLRRRRRSGPGRCAAAEGEELGDAELATELRRPRLAAPQNNQQSTLYLIVILLFCSATEFELDGSPLRFVAWDVDLDGG